MKVKTTISIFGISLLLIMSISQRLFGQSSIQNGCWAIGGITDDRCDGSGSIQQTNDGGYVICGYTQSFGAGVEDIYVIKLNNSGIVQWTKTIGGTGSDIAFSIQQTSDWGYVICGSTQSFGAGNSDVYVIKLDALGNLQWTKSIGGPGTETGFSIKQTNDGGYVITGNTSSFGAGSLDVYLIKLNSLGNVQWTKTIGGTSTDSGYSLQQTSEGGFVIAGYTQSFGVGSFDVYVVKLDSSGALLWTRTVGGSSADFAFSVHQTNDNGYVIGGSTQSFGAGNQDLYVIKLDSLGSLKWTKTIGGTNNDGGASILQASDASYVIGGTSQSYGAGNQDLYLVKLDSLGNFVWANTFGGAGSDIGSSIYQTNDGGFVIGGVTFSYGSGWTDFFIVRTDTSGNSCCASGNGGTLGSGGNIGNGGSVSSGGTMSSGGNVNNGFILTNICSATSLENLPHLDNKWNFEIQPNPVIHPEIQLEFYSTEFSKFSFTIYTITGEEISTHEYFIKKGNNRIKIGLEYLSKGFYFIRAFDGDTQIIKKFVKE